MQVSSPVVLRDAEDLCGDFGLVFGDLGVVRQILFGFEVLKGWRLGSGEVVLSRVGVHVSYLVSLSGVKREIRRFIGALPRRHLCSCLGLNLQVFLFLLNYVPGSQLDRYPVQVSLHLARQLKDSIPRNA